MSAINKWFLQPAREWCLSQLRYQSRSYRSWRPSKIGSQETKLWVETFKSTRRANTESEKKKKEINGHKSNGHRKEPCSGSKEIQRRFWQTDQVDNSIKNVEWFLNIFPSISFQSFIYIYIFFYFRRKPRGKKITKNSQKSPTKNFFDRFFASLLPFLFLSFSLSLFSVPNGLKNPNK